LASPYLECAANVPRAAIRIPLRLPLPHLPSAPTLTDGPLAVAALQTDASRRRIPTIRVLERPPNGDDRAIFGLVKVR
jgi:hypothetical protein